MSRTWGEKEEGPPKDPPKETLTEDGDFYIVETWDGGAKMRKGRGAEEGVEVRKRG